MTHRLTTIAIATTTPPAAMTIGTGVVLLLVALAGPAHAEATQDWGVSASAGLSLYGGTEVSGAASQSASASSALVGISVLGNVGQIVGGVIVEGMPDILGDGRLLAGLMLGWQMPLTRTHVQLMAEAGEDQLWDIGPLFSTVDPSTYSSPYVGARLRIASTLFDKGHFEGGLSLFARHDLLDVIGTRTDGNFLTGQSTSSPIQIGGNLIGLTLQLGFRMEGKLPGGPS